MRRMAIRFIGLAFAFPTMAQGVSQTDTEAGVDVAPITEQFNIDRSDRMTVQVRVNGSAPVPFIVDTGAERTVIASANSRWCFYKTLPALGWGANTKTKALRATAPRW